MAKPVKPAFFAPAWNAFARLRGGRLLAAQAVTAPEPEETPTVEYAQVPAVANCFRVIGVQETCRGKDECQDAFGHSDAGGGFVACIADGAGSSPCSRQGADCAVAAVLASIESSTGSPEERIRLAIQAAHLAVHELAAGEGRDAKDYRTTLAVAIGDGEKVVAGHVGDSLVVVADSHGIRPLLRPKNGEFGNTTYFVTAQDYETHLQFGETEGRWFGLAMQTDGLEAVTYWRHRDDLEVATYKALFSLLESLPEAEARQELSLFVSEDAIMDKCNDDLTLLCVVPVLTHADPRASDCSESAEPAGDHAPADDAS